jgi:hypothetical protein
VANDLSPNGVRIDVKLPVRLLGQDSYGIPFDSSCIAEVLNLSGASIRCSEELRASQPVSIGYRNRLVPAIVLARVHEDLYEVGFTAPQPDFWDIEFHSDSIAESFTQALLQCSSCSKMVPFGLTNFECILVATDVEVERFCPACNSKRQWKRATLGATLQAAASVVTDRRHQARVKVGFDAGVKWFGRIREGKVLDASRNGLRIVMDARFRVGDFVQVSAPYSRNTANIFLPFRVSWAKESEAGEHEYGLHYSSQAHY